MRIFEFYFNPKTKDGLIFESFCYEPENIYEKRKGSLYLVGSLKNVLPKNTKFLDNLANLIKQKYYSPTLKLPEKSFKESLKKTNEFLENIAKKGDVSWLGNLSFVALSLSFYQRPWQGIELNFTKVGDLKIFLLREGQVIDIDQKLKFDEIEPYPLKIFSNIISGKLVENDIILLSNQEVADTFFQKNILTEIANMAVFDPKRLKAIFNSKKEELLKISGICLLIVLTRESFTREKQTFLQKKSLEIFSYASFLRKRSVKMKRSFIALAKKFRVPLIRTPSLKLPKITIRPLEIKKWSKKLSLLFSRRASLRSLAWWMALNPGVKKNLITILVLLLFLLLGFLIFN